MRARPDNLSSALLATWLFFVATPSDAVEITSAAFDRGGINPSRAGFESDTLRVAFATLDPSVDVLVTLTGEGADRTLLSSTSSGGSFALGVTDTTGGPGLDEGTYAVTVMLSDSAGDADTTATFLVDETSPAFRSLTLTGPPGSFASGDYLPLLALMDEPIASFTLDVSEIDDVGDGASVLVEAHDDTTYGLLYRISPDNTTEDADNLALSATATDHFGNATTSADVLVCLSSFPPIFESKNLVDAVGDTIPNDSAFTGGDVLRMRTRFQTRFGDPLGPEQSIAYLVDLSDLDTEFQIFANPAVLDTVLADSLLDGEALVPGYVYRITAVHSYTLSEENARQEGRYDAVVTAMDQGCGEATIDPVFRILLADLGPDAPTFDPPPSTIVSTSRITLTGRAPGAVLVRIEREDGTPLADADVDTVAGTFIADVPLENGRNRVVAIASDAFNHDSDPSPVLEIFRIEVATLDVGARVRPGDPIEVALLEPADRLDLDIFNLAGDRIWHDTTTSRASVYAFTWNGRTRRGDEALSGPYIARVTIHKSGTKRALNEAFVFTRK